MQPDPAQRKIVALVDGSLYAQSVCDHAAWAAEGLSMPVELVHVIGRRDGAGPPRDLSGNIGLGARTALLNELAELDAQRAKLARKRGQAILEDAAARVRAAGAKAETRLRQGDLLDSLPDIEGGARLLVVGKRGEAADFATMHLGSNLERVVRAAHGNILICARAFRPITRLLVAFDGGRSIMAALDRMAVSPLLKGLDVHLLTVGTDATETRRLIDGAAAMLRDAGYAPTTEIAGGTPEEVLAERADAAEGTLLIMGAYGHSRIRALVVGSTTTAILARCKVPVLLFR